MGERFNPLEDDEDTAGPDRESTGIEAAGVEAAYGFPLSQRTSQPAEAERYSYHQGDGKGSKQAPGKPGDGYQYHQGDGKDKPEEDPAKTAERERNAQRVVEHVMAGRSISGGPGSSAVKEIFRAAVMEGQDTVAKLEKAIQDVLKKSGSNLTFEATYTMTERDLPRSGKVRQPSGVFTLKRADGSTHDTVKMEGPQLPVNPPQPPGRGPRK